MQSIFYVYIRVMESSSKFKSYLQGKYGSASKGKSIILARRQKYHKRIYDSYLVWYTSDGVHLHDLLIRSRYASAKLSWYALRLIHRLAK